MFQNESHVQLYYYKVPYCTGYDISNTLLGTKKMPCWNNLQIKSYNYFFPIIIIKIMIEYTICYNFCSRNCLTIINLNKTY
jgi:hypothetical protein